VSKLINLFGGPGVGKSTIAAGITYELKKNHITCDNPYEFPKVLAWDNNYSAIKDQLYVLANQHRGIAKSYGKVDYIVMDSPILLSLVYKTYYQSNSYPSNFYEEEFDLMVINLFRKYDSINVLLNRSEGKFNTEERYQDLSQSIELDRSIRNMLIKWDIPFTEINVDNDAVNNIVAMIK
jgi:CO dehydrogenase nickel-insertion accessory protein CooC1